MTEIDHVISDALEKSSDPGRLIQDIRLLLHKLSSQGRQPVDFVQWITIDKIVPNNYNPNSVARIEMGLLYKSISHDGYTQPIVVIYDGEQDKFVIVDGFHRYYVMKMYKDIHDQCSGMLPCVVLDKNINERMASTVRHNRARGRHSVEGMSNLVFKMLGNGLDDAHICNELGMSPEELLRIKHVTGFSKLFADHQYSRHWVTERQIDIAMRFKEGSNSTE